MRATVMCFLVVAGFVLTSSAQGQLFGRRARGVENSASPKARADADVKGNVDSNKSTGENGGKADANVKANATPDNRKVEGSEKVETQGEADGNQWRYRWHVGQWWYWLPSNRWVY